MYASCTSAGGLQRLAGPLAAHVGRGQPAQLVVDERREIIGWRWFLRGIGAHEPVRRRSAHYPAKGSLCATPSQLSSSPCCCPSPRSRRPILPAQALSANPFGAIVKWPNVEYERRVAPSTTLGVSASHFAETGQANAALLLRWYPAETALEGFYLGARAGAFRFETRRYRSPLVSRHIDDAAGRRGRVGYNWLLGTRRQRGVGIGFGLTRIVNGGDSWSVPEVMPGARLVNIGIAF